MKHLGMILLVMGLLFTPYYGNAQIKLYQNDNVKIGKTSGTAPTRQLHIWGDFWVGPEVKNLQKQVSDLQSQLKVLQESVKKLEN